jgi:hypothetical protein
MESNIISRLAQGYVPGMCQSIVAQQQNLSEEQGESNGGTNQDIGSMNNIAQIKCSSCSSNEKQFSLCSRTVSEPISSSMHQPCHIRTISRMEDNLLLLLSSRGDDVSPPFPQPCIFETGKILSVQKAVNLSRNNIQDVQDYLTVHPMIENQTWDDAIFSKLTRQSVSANTTVTTKSFQENTAGHSGSTFSKSQSRKYCRHVRRSTEGRMETRNSLSSPDIEATIKVSSFQKYCSTHATSIVVYVHYLIFLFNLIDPSCAPRLFVEFIMLTLLRQNN